MQNNLSFICDKYCHLTLCLLMNEPNCFHFECLKVQSRDSNLRPRVNFHDFTLELEVPGPHRLNRFQPDPAAFEDLLVFAPVQNRVRKPRAPEETRVRKLIMRIQMFVTSSISFFVRPHHRFVHPMNKGTQLFSFNQEQLPYPSHCSCFLGPGGRVVTSSIFYIN